ncbi:MAG: hypothetical protein ACI32C_01960 [Candidatus Enteromonas sp.]
MKNKKKILLLASVALLASCADTNELYDGDAFAGRDFVQNRYSVWADGLEVPSTKTTIQHGEHGYWNGSGKFDSPSDCFGLSEAKKWHPDYFKDGENDLTWTKTGDSSMGQDIVGGFINEWSDNSSLVGTVYGQTKKLANYHPGFRKGYLSKLYNGQVKCNGWSNYALVILDESGYGTRFPAELQKGSYFGFIARGASDVGAGRIISYDVNVTFYKYAANGVDLQGKSFLLEDVKLQANLSAEYTSFVGFSFEDVNYDPTGMVAMSMTYELKNDPASESLQAGETLSGNFEDEATYHTGLALTEVLLPDSTWN